MKIIGVDARSLEGDKTGMRRYLENMLKVWGRQNKVHFILYFQSSIPKQQFLHSTQFTLKVIGGRICSNFYFQHFLLPYHLLKDRVDFLFSPFYLRPLWCPVKSAIVLHDISYEAHPEWFSGVSQLVLRFFSRISARKAQIIFTVSEFSKQEIMRLYHIKPQKIVVSYLAPEADFLNCTNQDVVDVQKKYGVNKFLLYVGTIFTRRRVSELITAFAKFCKTNTDYHLVLIGRDLTYPFQNIQKQIMEVNTALITPSIIHYDVVNEADLIGLYKASTAVIYLSDYEGFGLPVVEGQFFKKPVITSYNSSLIEVGDQSVEFVVNNNEDDILYSLQKVLLNSDFREELIQRGQSNLQRFNWHHSANFVLAEILQIINKK